MTSVVNDLKEVRDGEDTIASTRDARAPRELAELFRILKFPISDCRFEQILTTENTEHAEARTVVDFSAASVSSRSVRY